MSVCPISRIADAIERVADALEHIAGNMDAETILAKKRKSDAERQAKHRSKSRDNVTLERTEEGKEEKSPHTSLKGVREEEKKEKKKYSRARARF